MSANTKIEWATNTWSPWLGCRKVSLGCENCYITSTPPYRMIGLKHGSVRVARSDMYWEQPLKWQRTAQRSGKAVYVFPSLMDWLDDEVELGWLSRFLNLIDSTPNLTWLLLTKRPDSIERIAQARGLVLNDKVLIPNNVWFGFSAENQTTFNERWEHARNIPCQKLFVSFEPLLESITLPNDFWLHEPWGIWGGESGPSSRPCQVDWIRNGMNQFQEHQCPVFIKQLGANPILPTQPHGTDGPAMLRDKKGGDWDEWPEDLRVREFPKC